MSAGSSFGGMCAAPAISAIVIALSGEPLDLELAVDQLDVLGRGLEQGARRSAWPCPAPCSPRGRSPRRRPTASASRTCPSRTGPGPCRRAAPRRSRGSMPEPVGHDLREARVEALAVRRGARVDGRRAARVHAHDRRLPERRLEADALRADRARRREAADLDVGREADAAVDALRRAARSCSLPERVEVARFSSSLSSEPVVVARVVDDPERASRAGSSPSAMKFVRRTSSGSMPSSAASWSIITSIKCVISGPPGAADGVGRELVREHAVEVELDVRDVVAAARRPGSRARG